MIDLHISTFILINRCFNFLSNCLKMDENIYEGLDGGGGGLVFTISIIYLANYSSH